MLRQNVEKRPRVVQPNWSMYQFIRIWFLCPPACTWCTVYRNDAAWNKLFFGLDLPLFFAKLDWLDHTDFLMMALVSEYPWKSGSALWSSFGYRNVWEWLEKWTSMLMASLPITKEKLVEWGEERSTTTSRSSTPAWISTNFLHECNRCTDNFYFSVSVLAWSCGTYTMIFNRWTNDWPNGFVKFHAGSFPWPGNRLFCRKTL